MVHVGVAFFRLLEVASLFHDQTVAVQEELLQVNVIQWELKLIEFTIIESLRWTSVRSATLAHVRLISLEEATEHGIMLGSLPVVYKVLERGKEFNDTFLDLRSDFIFVSEVQDEMLLQAQVSVVDSTIDFWSMEDPMVINVVDLLFKLSPVPQSELELLLSSLQATACVWTVRRHWCGRAMSSEVW